MKDIIQQRNLGEIRIRLQISELITALKKNSSFYDPYNDPKLNRLCYVEDWNNTEINDKLLSCNGEFV
jgi:hypothetical protein